MMMANATVPLDFTDDYSATSPYRRRSTSFLAVKEAVYQLTCLNDFVCEKIGAGFFADVYKVKHKTTGEVMVLKMNRCSKNKKQMLAEIQLLNRLSHPNILSFKGSCVHEGQLHALTEYINGGTVEELLQDDSVSLPWTVRIKMAIDIAKGMEYLHSKGVFHRDLTSKNCLLQKNPNGSLKTVVADFGLAAKIKHKQKRRSYTETVGSVYWMAPECIRGREYCEQADVFSYGIILAEITSRLPADPDFIPRTHEFGVHFDELHTLINPGCPPLLWELLQQCSKLNPDERPTFKEIVEILETITVEEESSSVSESKKILISSQSEPMLLLTKGEETDGSYEFSQRSPTTPSSHGDPEDTLTSLLNGTAETNTHGNQKRKDFLVQESLTSTPNSEHRTGDSGIDPGFWVRSVSHHRNSVDTPPYSTPEHRSLRLEKTSSPSVIMNGSGHHFRETSDSSEISFHLPSPSFAWAPPSSPTASQRSSFSFPSSPNVSRRTSLVINESSSSSSSGTRQVGVVKSMSESHSCSKDIPPLTHHNHSSSVSTPNLQSV